MSVLASQLNAIEDRAIDVYLASLQGEPFHPEYRKYPDLFKRLIRSDLKTEREAKKYFTGLSDRINERFNRYTYDQRKAAINIDDFVQVDWDEEGLLLRATLSDALVGAVVAGGLSLMEDTGIADDWDLTSTPVSRFLRNYTFDLVKGLTKVTQDRLRESLLTSLELGESTDEAQQRIAEVIADPRRAATIARTESVTVYSSAREEVGGRIGANRKGWSAFLDNRTSVRCRDGLHGQVVKIGENFKSKVDHWEGPGPASHPNCRCHKQIYMPNEKV